eukprot:jgi/Mesvir1/3538/Mv12009-RA.1
MTVLLLSHSFGGTLLKRGFRGLRPNTCLSTTPNIRPAPKTPVPNGRRWRLQVPASSVNNSAVKAMASFHDLKYPAARRDETVVEELHGVLVPDPYRWLEDPDAEETQNFVRQQNEVTAAVLAKCTMRDKFQARMTDLYDYPKYGTPFKEGDKYFYYYNSGLQPQSVLYMQDTLESEAEVFLDPNVLSEDGTVALAGLSFSDDGRYASYGLSANGSDWQTIRVKRVADKEALEDTIKWVKHSSMAWTHDNKGFFYCRYPEPSSAVASAGTETDANENQQLWYHFLGNAQADDVLCFDMPEQPKWAFGAQVTDDGKYLLVSIHDGCDPFNRLFYCDLDKLAAEMGGMQGFKAASASTSEKLLLPLIKLVDNFEAEWSYVANNGDAFTLRTNRAAPRYKLVRLRLGDADPVAGAADLIPQSDVDVLDWAQCVNQDKLVVCYTHDVKNQLHLHMLDSGKRVHTFELDIGSIGSATGRRQDDRIFFKFTGFLTPSKIYSCDLSTGGVPQPYVFRQADVKGLNVDDFMTEQVFVPSKDGTKIPMFIVSRKDMPRDNNNPALLYGYGGFNISLMPSFSVSYLVFVAHFHGVVAVANLRGGGEYGEEWRASAALGKKQNCFDDCHACAAYLASPEAGYTSSRKLALMGHSNGGLLVGACSNQRPDLYGCAIGYVGVMDMLRFHKFTIGHAWMTFYGDPDKKEDFEYLIKYSPLHNVRRPWERDDLPQPATTQHPATMLLAADHDDRVVPLHTLKYGATLQHLLCNGPDTRQTNPIILRIDTKAGHGAGKPTKKIIEEASDVYGFMAHVLGATWHD